MDIEDIIDFSTIRIEVDFSYGKTSSGTGFFFNFVSDKGKSICAIVTNKHVIAGAVEGRLSFNTSDEQGSLCKNSFFNVSIPDFESKWVFHPSSKIDLAIMPIENLIIFAKRHGTNLLIKTLDKSLIPSQKDLSEFFDIEDLIFVGYPNAIYDVFNNRPIVRRGLTASSVKYKFNNEPCFIMDGAIFGGSSGSPVFIYSNGIYRTTEGYMQGERAVFVGIIKGVYEYSASNENETKEKGAFTTIPEGSYVTNNLGVVINSETLLDFVLVISSDRFSQPTFGGIKP